MSIIKKPGGLLAVLSAMVTATFSPALALSVGDTAPNVEGRAAVGGKIAHFDLKADLEKHAVVLYFFPAAFTAG